MAASAQVYRVASRLATTRNFLSIRTISINADSFARPTSLIFSYPKLMPMMAASAQVALVITKFLSMSTPKVDGCQCSSRVASRLATTRNFLSIRTISIKTLSPSLGLHHFSYPKLMAASAQVALVIASCIKVQVLGSTAVLCATCA